MATQIEVPFYKTLLREFLAKVNSDRLWVLVLYVVVLALNAKLGIGIAPEQMSQLLYAVIAFIIGKSWRSTVGPVATDIIQGIDIAKIGTANRLEAEEDKPTHRVTAPREPAVEPETDEQL